MPVETYVLFELAGAAYGLRSREVQHIEMLEHVTQVPNTVPAVEGVVFSRGHVIPAMNLRVRFGFPRAETTLQTRLIVVQMHQRSVALIVDAAREFRGIPDDAIRPIEETITGINGNYLRGVTSLDNRLVLLLNLESILDLNEAKRAAETASEAENSPSDASRSPSSNTAQMIRS